MGASAVVQTPGHAMGAKKEKSTLYVEIDKALKDRIDRLALVNGRKLVAEVTRALEFYLAAHEAPAEKPSKK